MARERASRWPGWGRWALLAGIVLLAASLVVRDVRARTMVETDRVAFGLLIGGLALALGGALLNVRAFLGILRGRRTMEGVNFAVVVLLFLSLAGLLCYISTRWFARMDWTGKRTYSLHSKTVNVLRGLDRDVEAVLVTEPTVSPADQRALDLAQDLLEEFKSVGSHFSVRRLNWTTPEGQQQLQELTQRMAGEEPPRFSVIFFTSDLHEIVPFDGLFRPAAGGLEFTGEDAFAAALAKLTDDKKASVYFLTGHGERPFETEEPNPMVPQPTAQRERPELTLSRIAKALRGDNYEVSALNLAAEGSVPDDCAVLIVAGPRAPLAEAEVKAVRAYLEERNGSAIVLVDPLAVSIEKTNVNDLIGPYGLKARIDALGITNVSILGRVMQMAEVLVTPDDMGRHPITSGLENYNLSPRYACPIEVDESAAPAGARIVKLLSGSKASWGETDYKPASQEPCEFDQRRDIPPPLVVAALMAPRAPAANPMMPQPVTEPAGAKLLVVGSSLTFVNGSVDENPANRYFLMNAVNWMGGKLHMLGIPPKTLEMSQATPTDAQLRTGRYAFIAVLPACIVAAGVSVWLVRRKRR